jgi:hypothetical protein
MTTSVQREPLLSNPKRWLLDLARQQSVTGWHGVADCHAPDSDGR